MPRDKIGRLAPRHGGSERNKRRSSSELRAAAAESRVRYDEAVSHLKTGSYKRALQGLFAALELQPNDKHALVARSKCHLLLGLASEALQDADAALSHDKTFVKGIFQKAEALYHLGDFEHSLMFYHRGLRLRPEMAGFRLGVQKAQEAIENTIGKGCCARLQMPDAPSESTTSRASSAALPSLTIAVPRAAAKSAASSVGSSSRSKAPPKRHLLGQLSVDKSYLEALLEHPDMQQQQQQTEQVGTHITKHAQEGVAFLKRRQQFWRQQCPNTPAPPVTRVRAA